MTNYDIICKLTNNARYANTCKIWEKMTNYDKIWWHAKWQIMQNMPIHAIYNTRMTKYAEYDKRCDKMQSMTI